MASLKTDMLANIAGSMQDRPTIRGESMEIGTGRALGHRTPERGTEAPRQRGRDPR
jgi:hypothetical protein